LLTHTLAAHGPEAQTRLKLALFDAHFQQRRDVSDRAVLADIYESLGLPRYEAEVAFDDPVLGDRVRAEEAQAWDMNISGVPAMLVNAKYLIPGGARGTAGRNRRTARTRAQRFARVPHARGGFEAAGADRGAHRAAREGARGDRAQL